jgi:hypothetical protein
MSPFGWEIIPPKRAQLLSGLTTWEMAAALTRGQTSRRRVDAVLAELAKIEHSNDASRVLFGDVKRIRLHLIPLLDQNRM